MLIEQLVEGNEVTVGILGDEALPVIEIIPPKDQEFDYENKYNGATAELCPPVNVSEELQRKAQELAVAVHNATGCRHLSRTDIMINNTGDLYIIDTNTLPGLTGQSLYPKAAAEAGYDWAQLVQRFASLI
jgi:D-alanine-D-alanine ligase